MMPAARELDAHLLKHDALLSAWMHEPDPAARERLNIRLAALEDLIDACAERAERDAGIQAAATGGE